MSREHRSNNPLIPLQEEANLEAMLEEAKAKTAVGDHEGALMLYSAAQTQYPNEPEVEYGLKAAEAALQKSMEGTLLSNEYSPPLKNKKLSVHYVHVRCLQGKHT